METRALRVAARDLPAEIDALVALGYGILNIEERRPFYLVTIDFLVPPTPDFLLIDASTDVLLIDASGDKLIL